MVLDRMPLDDDCFRIGSFVRKWVDNTPKILCEHRPLGFTEFLGSFSDLLLQEFFTSVFKVAPKCEYLNLSEPRVV